VLVDALAKRDSLVRRLVIPGCDRLSRAEEYGYRGPPATTSPSEEMPRCITPDRQLTR
jgi:hypothetical protein